MCISNKIICQVLGRLTLWRIAQLGNIMLELIEENEKYRNKIDNFLKEKSVF